MHGHSLIYAQLSLWHMVVHLLNSQFTYITKWCHCFGRGIKDACEPIVYIEVAQFSWLRHQMITFSALLAICPGNSPVTGEFFAQRPVTRSFDVFFDLRLNKRLSKQSWCWWFEMPSRPLWRHCNVIGDFAQDRSSWTYCRLWHNSWRTKLPGDCKGMEWNSTRNICFDSPLIFVGISNSAKTNGDINNFSPCIVAIRSTQKCTLATHLLERAQISDKSKTLCASWNPPMRVKQDPLRITVLK